MTQTLDAASSRHAEVVARAVRVCNTFGVMDYNGHVSQRDAADPNVFWINNRHASRSTLTAGDIVPFDIAAGRRIGEGIEPPSEWPIHREIYRRRPDVGGIVHSHPTTIVMLSAAGVALRPIMQAGVFLPESGAPVFDSGVLINTEARGAALADALGDGPIVVLRQHGAVTVGRSAEEAAVNMVKAEENARTLYMALQVGTPRYLQGEELRVLGGEHGWHGVMKSWHYLEETAARQGAFAGL